MSNLANDFRHAWRRLRASPVFTVFAVATLALGIGTTTAIYSAVRGVLSPPAGVVDPETLVHVTRSAARTGPLATVSWAEFQDFTERQTTFSAVAGWQRFRRTQVVDGRSLTAFTEAVSGDYFRALGVTVALGRAVEPSDDRPDASPVVVISQATWGALFDQSPDAIGRTVNVDGVAMTVVGVTGTAFTGMFNGGVVATSAWMPMATLRVLDNFGSQQSFDPTERDSRWINLLARVAPGRSMAEARGQVAAIGTGLNTAFPQSDDTRQTRGPANGQPTAWIATPVSEEPKLLGARRILGPMVSALITAVILVLLVACTNLANLTLARAASRRQEAAMRGALGASRWRLIREAMAESTLLAAAGGTLAVGVALVLMRVLSTQIDMGAGNAARLQLVLDIPVLATGCIVTLLALMVSGLWPALRSSRTDLRSLMASDGGGTPSTRWRVRRYLIATQVGVSAALVVVAALAVTHVRTVAARDPGYDADHLAFLDLDFGAQRVPPAQATNIVNAWLSSAASLPDVRAVAASSGLPGEAFRHASLGGATGRDRESVNLLASTPGVLSTLGLTVLQGRGLDERDTNGAMPVVILGERTARNLFGGEGAVGQVVTVHLQIYAGETPAVDHTRVVVGVVREATPPDPRFRTGLALVPLAQNPERRLILAVRADDPAGVLPRLRQSFQRIAPDLGVKRAGTGATIAREDILFFEIVAGLTTTLGGFAMAIALAGLYGILSFVIAGRTREIGIRLALGAEARSIHREVIREGLAPVIVGLVLGLAGGLMFRQAAIGLVPGLAPAVSPMALTIVPALFVAAGVAACYLPARRASRVDPQVALRSL